MKKRTAYIIGGTVIAITAMCPLIGIIRKYNAKTTKEIKDAEGAILGGSLTVAFAIGWTVVAVTSASK
jgi:hypothetical protein